jgi:2-polyprenyl-6-hydroxyphenyl methylase / 3-demethylubiquinone-9 3-methyltransferase
MLRKDIRKAFPVQAGTGDPAEIARFNALAEEWWKPNGAFKVVHAFNHARVAHISERLAVLSGRDPHAPSPLAGLKIIDVGCGAGLVAEPLSRLGANVLGIDAAERNVAVAQQHAQIAGSSAKYRHALPEDCGDLANSFDVVMSLEVVEHVADLRAFLDGLRRLVAPGGILLIGTINRTMRSYVKAIVGAEYVMRWLPVGTHDWRKFVKPIELEEELRRHGFSVTERIGVNINPWTMRWGVGPDVSVNFLQFHRLNLSSQNV